MLRRAASNAYSWWWASNILTKQSKWLDANLHEMEEKVKTMIKLIEVDADSFAKKAEMYYQRRPELIRFVEDAYKTYKALADRYDRISGELLKANHTIASNFPDQFQSSMQDDEEDGPPKAFTDIDISKSNKPPTGEAPQISFRNKSKDTWAASKKHHKKVISHVTKENAQNEVDRLQKEILVLQTEKEFVKSSCESTAAKVWEIENQITDLQGEVCALQGEYSVSSMIDDNEARALMAGTVIKSCEESLVSLQQQQKKSGEEAEMEYRRISEVKNRIKFLMDENCSPEMEETVEQEKSNKGVEGFQLKNEGLDLHAVCTPVKQLFQMDSDTSTVELAEKIDELVEKVFTLEGAVLLETAQLHRLRSETDMLLKFFRIIVEDKANMFVDSNSLNVRLRQAENELHGVQELEKIMHHEKGILQTHFLEGCNSLNSMSEKMESSSLKEKDGSPAASNIESLEKNKKVKEEIMDEGGDAVNEEDEVLGKQEVEQDKKDLSEFVKSWMVKIEQQNAMISSLLKDLESDDRDNIPDIQKLLHNRPEGRQNMLLYGYSSILHKYKDTKKRLAEMEKKNQEYHFETMAQIQELKSENAVKDQEIRDLRRKLLHHTSSKGATTSQNEMIEEENGSSIQKLSVNPAEIEEEIKLCHLDQQNSNSSIEEKFRTELDTLLNENLSFWLRFSTSYHQIQKFDMSFKELEACVDKMKDPKEYKSAPASPMHSSNKETTPPLDKKLRELHAELQVWLEQNELLKGELQCRFTSLCNIQEEISKASSDTEGDDSKFSPYLAAKFQGELLNMQQENNKVDMELQTGLDHVKALQSQVGKALSNLRESFDLSVSDGYQQYQNFRHCSTRSKVPLRTFLFGEKRRKPSIFSCMSPVLYRHHSLGKSGFSKR
ncbi:protein NETWORKED 2D [Phalaenopsis equestris]|uniref:protein NETWORKED 2D n=1 Tax=Phalaenopsis equestris TaxID=78828 RepID=UPI0009E3392E|nr:protein NETWORKED 2D [Phalaenopsis equestris]